MDIPGRGVVASGTNYPHHFIEHYSYDNKYYILFHLRTFQQGAWGHLGQPLLIVFYCIIPITLNIIYYSS